MIDKIAAALLLVQAAPAEPPCITHEEAGDMAVALLPFFLDAAVSRCRPHLGAEAFLLNGGAEWSARLRRDSAPRRASALRGIGKMGAAAPPQGPSGDAAFDFVAQLATSSLTGGIRPENCGQIDSIAEALSPLPTDNIARLVGAGLALAVTANAAEEQPGQTASGEQGEPAASAESGEPPICRS